MFGLGRIGKVHLRSLLDQEDVCIRYLVDVTAAQGDLHHLVRKYRLAETTTVLSTEEADVVYKDPCIDAVFICTPSPFHEEPTQKALQAGKHVFCEKPLALTEQGVRSCYDAARKSGKNLLCAFNRRFDPDLSRIHKMKEDGELGRLRSVTVFSLDKHVPLSYIKTSGGIYVDSCVHMLDYVCWFVGERPLSVYVCGSNNSTYADDYEASGDHDITNIVLTFPSGVLANMMAGREVTYGYDQHFQVLGSKKMAMSKNYRKSEVETWDTNGSLAVDLMESFIERWSSSYTRIVRHFIDVVHGREECMVSAEECMQSLELVKLCEESVRSGKVVSVAPRPLT
ncbi:inositol 2-dehydrogenase-like [Haliotis rubra]|uniref:inositol 2-dehydrogenase-like n=1 Tax=Haliotis rubra TaxID=36100 RepID=UPI001EE5EF6A|nr:inositol 2-dehydrogenase-like [Haliotis rubra]